VGTRKDGAAAVCNPAREKKKGGGELARNEGKGGGEEKGSPGSASRSIVLPGSKKREKRLFAIELEGKGEGGRRHVVS